LRVFRAGGEHDFYDYSKRWAAGPERNGLAVSLRTGADERRYLNGDVFRVETSYKLLYRQFSDGNSTIDGNLSECHLVLSVNWGSGDFE
jgi:hypothetical protein